MALPSSGQITLKQINAEFGGSNTIKSNATNAGISTSNVGCKSFYGLSSFAYYDDPPDMAKWDDMGYPINTGSVGGGIPVYEIKVKKEQGKFGVATTEEKMSKYLTGLSPGTTYDFGFDVEAWSTMQSENTMYMYIIPGNSSVVGDAIAECHRTYTGSASSTVVAPASGNITILMAGDTTFNAPTPHSSSWYINSIFIA